MEKIKKFLDKIKNNKIIKLEIIAIIVILILGTLLHFTYEWSGDNLFVGSFSAVNESVWEHLKLVFYPMLLMGIINYFLLKGHVNNYIEAKAIGIFVAISFIIVFFFTYVGILGTNFFILDILPFILSVSLGEWVSYKLMTREDESNVVIQILSFLILIFLLLCFIIFTYNPPKVNLFKDPRGTYGIEKYNEITGKSTKTI